MHHVGHLTPRQISLVSIFSTFSRFMYSIFTCSEPTIITLEEVVKHVQSNNQYNLCCLRFVSRCTISIVDFEYALVCCDCLIVIQKEFWRHLRHFFWFTGLSSASTLSNNTDELNIWHISIISTVLKRKIITSKQLQLNVTLKIAI